MFLVSFIVSFLRSCFPRVRGDVPHIQPSRILICEFSPRARGCSDEWILDPDTPEVFPACAGMFPQRDAALLQ